MSIFTKLLTLFRGTAHDAGAAVVDKNALRILDQEIRDADSALNRARDDLASLVARRRILEKELDVVKVNESVQRAQAAVASQGQGASAALGSAADSLKRIKERQAVRDERFKAAAELEDRRTGADLDAKLSAAGILPGQTSADDVLARLRAPAGEPMPLLNPPNLQIEAQPTAVPRTEES